jgi:hypothetical protein
MITLPWAIIISAVALIFTASAFWKSHKKDKIQLKVVPKLYRHVENAVLCSTRIPDNMSEVWHGLCVEIINVGFIAATIQEIGLRLKENGEIKVIVFPQGQFPNNEKPPKRLEPKSSIVYYIPSVDPQAILHEGLPFAKCFFVRTACGVTIDANSKVTKWLISKGKQKTA